MANGGVFGELATALFGGPPPPPRIRWFHRLRRAILAICNVAVYTAGCLLLIWAAIVAAVALGNLIH